MGAKRQPRAPRPVSNDSARKKPSQRPLANQQLVTSTSYLAWALEDLRRWFEREVALERARNALAESGLQNTSVEDLDVASEDPRRGGYFDSEIALAARSEKHKPVEWLWLIQSSQWLDDDELAKILSPAHYRDHRAQAVAAVSKKRRRAEAWWAGRTRTA